VKLTCPHPVCGTWLAVLFTFQHSLHTEGLSQLAALCAYALGVLCCVTVNATRQLLS
jgi:hypothetical protein